jgi:hypothetical protein
MAPLGAYYQGRSSLSKAEIEIATNLTNARWLAAYSNYEHEMIAQKDASARVAPRSRRLVSALTNNTAFIAIKMGRRTKSQIDSPPGIGSMVHEKNRVNCLVGGLCD